jgi:alcohol dehydrogenase class IV
MLGAFCAGVAICTAGTAGAHAIQSPMGAITHTAHGLGVGALLPYVMRFNLPERVAEMAEVGLLLGAAQHDDGQLAQRKRRSCGSRRSSWRWACPRPCASSA